jgi:hypothetical protein
MVAKKRVTRSHANFYAAVIPFEWKQMKADHLLAIVVAAGLIFVVTHAQSRFDICRRQGQKNIACVLQF